MLDCVKDGGVFSFSAFPSNILHNLHFGCVRLYRRNRGSEVVGSLRVHLHVSIGSSPMYNAASHKVWSTIKRLERRGLCVCLFELGPASQPWVTRKV